MRRAGLGGATGQVLNRFAGFKQTALRRSETLFGRSLIELDLDDRTAGFVLAAIEQLSLILELTAFASELLTLLIQPGLFIVGPLDLRVVANHRLFLPMVLGVQCGNDASRLLD